MIEAERTRTRSRTDTLYFRGVDPALHAQFKAWCAKRGLTMKEVVMRFMGACIRGESSYMDKKRGPKPKYPDHYDPNTFGPKE